MAEMPAVGDVFDLKSPLFSRDFVVVDLLPSITLVACFTCVLLSGAPGKPPNGADFTQGLSQITGISLFLSLVMSVVVGLALHPFSVRFRRVLTGQWTHPITRPMAVTGRWLSRRRFKKASRHIDADVTTSRSELARWSEIHRRELPEPPFLMPTRLGNAYQALRKCVPDGGTEDDPLGPTDAEIYRSAYLDAHDRDLAIAQLIDDARLKCAAAERYIIVWLLAAVALAWVLHDHGWWLLLSAAALGLSRLAYLGAVQAVVEYSYLVDDLFRDVDAKPTQQAAPPLPLEVRRDNAG
jgi:hypothetical protein